MNDITSWDNYTDTSDDESNKIEEENKRREVYVRKYLPYVDGAFKVRFSIKF